MILYIDTETYSPAPIGAGLARYATEVEVMVVTWAVDDGPVRTWDVTLDPLDDGGLFEAAEDCTVVVAHNAQFDRLMLRRSIPDLAQRLEGKWYCTMAAALRHGLPGGLDKLSAIFKLPPAESKYDGRLFINLFCKPDKDGKRETRETRPEQWAGFLEYAGQDIVAMRQVHKKLPKWNDTPDELALWDLDQTINERGIAVDVEFAKAAKRATSAEQRRITERTGDLTEDVVLRPTQRDQLLAYLFAEHGVELPNLRADTVERRLDDPELSEVVKELLRMRISASKSSTAKYTRLLDLQVDGRLHYLLQYCGANRTGRWAGRNVQPQNFPRSRHKYAEIEAFIEAAKLGCEDITHG